ncbi:MAG: hypothetical protein ABIB71_01085 [Candidatus Woesearchaeota archaeon]
MIVKILGLVDLAAALVLFGLRFWDLKVFGLILGAMVAIKALVFIKEHFASIIDLLAVAFIVLASFGYYNVLTYLFVIWLLQKSVRSLF